ncbi:MAG: ATP-binding protein [Bacillota bacterium]
MKKITVISGKGGTGKTTFTANLVSLMDKVVIADCDVDAPNLHLLLKPENRDDEIYRGAKLAVKDEEKCINCGLCYDNCRFNAIRKSDFSVIDLKCEGCGVCAEVCPTDALKMEEIVTGNIYRAESKYGPMIHARLIPGADTSGKLVSEVKKIADEKAKEINADWIIVDGSPGIGCPVIASLNDADMALLVTEPTLTGFSDLRRVIEVIDHFNIEAGLIINKFDINEAISDRIEEYCRNENIELFARIPYSKKIVDSLQKGELFAANPENEDLKEMMLQVVSKIKNNFKGE